jgi:hypothetical protein
MTTNDKCATAAVPSVPHREGRRLVAPSWWVARFGNRMTNDDDFAALKERKRPVWAILPG